VGRWLDQPTRIVLRQLLRWPLRSFLTASGIAMAVAVLVTSLQWLDSIDRIVEMYFHEAQHQDVTVAMVEPQSPRILYELARMPGVLTLEPGRSVSVEFRSASRRHRGAIEGVLAEPSLNLIQDTSGASLRVPSAGLVISTSLAKKLGVRLDDVVWVEVLEGRRPTVGLPVVGVFETYIGTPAYMNLGALNRLMLEGPRIGHVHLLLDRSEEKALFAELKDIPAVSAVSLRRASIVAFHDTVAETLLIYVSFFVAFACTLAFGVVYNSARIALSERGRELATLRVLGFGRAEIAYILLGEVAILVFLALPLGCLAGYGLAWLITTEFETELFRVPFVIRSSTYGWAVIVGIAAAVVSAYLVRLRLDRLDLIAVLKTRE
jgi:putative ABC transport system permease protein